MNLQESEASALESKAPLSFNSECPAQQKVCLTDDQAIELMSDWVMLAILSIVDKRKNLLNAKFVSSILGVSREKAQTSLEMLVNLGILEERDGGFFGTINGFHFDEEFIRSSELLTIHKRVGKLLEEKMTSRDVFGTHVTALNIKIVQAHMPKIIELIQSLEESSKSDDNAKDIYAFQFAFVKISRGSGAINENN